MKILVIGSGGREHAIASKFVESDQVERVYVAPGNPGMARTQGIFCEPIDVLDFEGLIAFAQKKGVAFTFVGPEVPLVAGIVDQFELAGLRIFGPNQLAAEIEGSKAFAKDLMKAYQIPTANYETFDNHDKAKAYLETQTMPIVVKADGLAAGKGVTVAESLSQALAALEEIFAQSGARVVIEEFLEGEECSLLSFVVADKVYPMILAQDHKRAYDGDKGPNTGGMGAYAPVPHIADSVILDAVESIVKPTAVAMVAEGRPFTGILYTGLILTESGPKVIEYNARFGDPETQVILPRLTSDFAQIIVDLLEGREPQISWLAIGVTLGVVVASEGYPGDYEPGAPLPDIPNDLGVYYAGVDLVAGHLAANGGRVYLVTRTAESMRAARKALYASLDQLDNTGLFYRHDIGWRAE